MLLLLLVLLLLLQLVMGCVGKGSKPTTIRR